MSLSLQTQRPSITIWLARQTQSESWDDCRNTWDGRVNQNLALLNRLVSHEPEVVVVEVDEAVFLHAVELAGEGAAVHA